MDDLDARDLLMAHPTQPRAHHAIPAPARCAVAVALLIAATAPAAARVFSRWGSHRDVAAALANLGGKSGYTAEISVNGQDGSAQVFRMPDSLRETIAALERRFTPLTFTYAGGSMGIGTLVKDNVRLFMIALRLGLSDHTVVMTVTLTGASGTAPPAAPTTHLLTQLPEYPGSAPSFYAHDRNAGMRLAVATTIAQPEDVRRFYTQRLTQSGWKPALPEGAGTPRELDMYLRERETCCVTATPSTTSRETRITLLHKEPGRDK